MAKIMGFLGILGDSARILKNFDRILEESSGFSGFPQDLYEVFGVSSPSISMEGPKFIGLHRRKLETLNVEKSFG